ncbi:hypothetical protein AK830_g8963 [Neonectria ditissima]|uniref:FAD-binding domain-containing protein n=1 Tax=Neonectria ditissima TaxID=78410 RepID=A0A0P7ASS6_9HYPO|nr:hypothetical protein AK830_g8963 [Neonectria ditissima]
MPTKPVLIIGAGVVGLSLACGLKEAGVPFDVYERDDHVSARGQGWALTLHWVLPYLKKLLLPSTVAEIEAAQVDPDADRDGPGTIVLINAETLEPKFRIPAGERLRVNREKLRNVLLQEVSDRVHWGKRLTGIEADGGDGGVVALFEDGSRAEGAVLVGAEGSNSRTRKFLAPATYRNTQLPVRCVGCAVDFTASAVQPLRRIDPLLFQGCHPASGSFLWVSMLETPGINGTRGSDAERYRVQINISWPAKTVRDEVAATDAGRLAGMKQRAEGFHAVLGDAVRAIPEGSAMREMVVQDWPCLPWDNRGGRVTLAGDAAHAMTVYRGEAANHGILDAYRLCARLAAVYGGGLDVKAGVDGYEAELRERTSAAVLLNRRACLEAHDWAGLDGDSAVLKRSSM